MRLLLIVVAIFTTIVVCQTASRDRNNKKYKVVCYWGSWSYYRPGDGKYQPEDANPNICTHMIYGFAKLNADNTIAVYDPDFDLGDTEWSSGLTWGHGGYRRFNGLRSYNAHLTTLIAIGGWNEGSDKYSHMVSSAATRKVFVDSVVKFLNTYDFDGLDVDWEYPAMKAVGDQDRTNGTDSDKQNFVELLKELHAAFQDKGYLLTAAVSAGKPTIDRAYNVPEVTKYLDIINVMTYDFHGAWDNRTAHNAPLHPKSTDSELDQEFTVEYAINYWLKLGATASKMVMGMPLYARTFTLAGTESGYRAPATGAGGNAGPFSRLQGTLGYNEVCDMLKKESSQWKITRDDTYKIPFAVKGNQWIGYDDVQSITDKVNFIKSKNLGGGMVWSIDTDDFHGLCTGTKYPLLKTISQSLNGVNGPDVVIPETHVNGTTAATNTGTTPSKATTKPPNGTTKPPSATTKGSSSGTFTCTVTGFQPDPNDRTIFHECVDIGSGLKDFVYHCGEGTVYDPVNHVCGFP